MIDRRDFPKTGAALSAVAALPGLARAGAIFAPDPGAWRSYDIVTRIELAGGAGTARAWVPLPVFAAANVDSVRFKYLITSTAVTA